MFSVQTMFSTYPSAAPLRCAGSRGWQPLYLQILATNNNKKPRKDGLTGQPKRKRQTPAHRLTEKNLKILEVNIGELSNICNEQRPSIVVVVETFLDPSVKDGADSISIPGYSLCCRRDRTEKQVQQRGGIAVYCAEGVAIHHDAKRDPKHL